MEYQVKQDLHDDYSWRRRMNSLYENWVQQRGLSTYTLFVLYALIEKDGCTAKEICKTWILPKQTVSSILKQQKNSLILYLILQRPISGASLFF